MSEYVPIAVNWSVRPLAMLELGGVMPIETRVAAVTVSVVDPDAAPKVALIVVGPGLSAVTSPMDPVLLLTDADVAEEPHVTEVVRLWVEWSV